MTLEELIRQSYERAGLWPYSQKLQTAQLQTGLRLLRGLVSRYNNDDLLAFTMNDFDLDLKGGNIVNITEDYKGFYNFETKDDVPDEYNKTNGIGIYVWADNMFYINVSDVSTVTGYDWLAVSDIDGKIKLLDKEYDISDYITNAKWLNDHKGEHWLIIPNVEKIRTISSKPNIQTLDEYVQTKFVPYDSFKNLSASANCYTVRETATTWQLLFKSVFAKQNRNIIVSYNESFDVSWEDAGFDLVLSDIYIELLIQGLTVKLLHLYPNDETTTARMENELANIIANVRTPRANMKMVKRATYDYCSTADSLLAGEGLWL